MAPPRQPVTNQPALLQDGPLGSILCLAALVLIIRCCAEKNKRTSASGQRKKDPPVEERAAPSYIGKVAVIRESQSNEQTTSRPTATKKDSANHERSGKPQPEIDDKRLFLTDDEPAPGYSSCLTPKAWDLPQPPEETRHVETKPKKTKKEAKQKTHAKKAKKERHKRSQATTKQKKESEEKQ
uniref:Uncharacterized protein n=1 Tax=Trichuris muris TaxID=70415 RepID=A0A5S6QBX3_TRIMR